MMETQRLLDALTDHLQLYHLCTLSRERVQASNDLGGKKDSVSCSRDRLKVVEWFRGLNTDQKQAALTVVDRQWVALVLQMQKQLETNGLGYFFVLPDIPSFGSDKGSTREPKHNIKTKSSCSCLSELGHRCKKPLSSSAFRDHQNSGPARNKPGRLSSFPRIRDMQHLPSLCFRKAKGLMARLSDQKAAGDYIVNHLRVYSSQDGEKIADGAPVLDTMTFSAEFVNDVDKFLETMDTLSYHAFLNNLCVSGSSSWDETPWLKGMGFYSMPTYVVNKLEFALCSGWISALGTKRPSKAGPSIKAKRAHTLEHITLGCSPYAYETAALASRVCKKRQGCVQWWSNLNVKTRKNVIKVALIAAIKIEVRVAVKQAEKASTGNSGMGALLSGGIRYKGSRRADIGSRPVELSCCGSLGSINLQNLTGLEALLEFGELWLKCTFPDSDWLFHSLLNVAESLSGYIVRNIRNNLMKVMNSSSELELIHSENLSNKPIKSIPEKPSVKMSNNTNRKKSQTQTKISPVLKQEKAFTEKPKIVKVVEQEVELEASSKEGTVIAPNCQAKNEEKQGVSGKRCQGKKLDGAGKKRSTKGESCKKAVSKEHMRREDARLHLSTKGSHSRDNSLEKSLPSHGEESQEFNSEQMTESSNIIDACFHLSTKGSHCTAKVLEKSLPSHEEEAQEYNSEQMTESSNIIECTQTESCSLTIRQPKLTVLKSPYQAESSNEVKGFSPITNVEVERETDVTTCKVQMCKSGPGVSSFTPTKTSLSADLRSSLASTDAGNKQHCSTQLVTVKSSDEMPSFSAGVSTSIGSIQPLNEPERVDGVFPLSAFNNEMCHLRSLKHPKLTSHQHSAFVLPLSHEWPGSPRTRFSAGVCLPTTTDRLHLDAANDLPQRIQASFVSIRNPGLACQPGSIENLLHRHAGGQNVSASLDWPPFTRSGINFAPTIGYPLHSKEEPAYFSVSPFSPSPFARSWAGVESNGRYRISEDGDFADRINNEVDFDDSTYAVADSDEADRHTASEEENDRRFQHANTGYEADYNQFFGGGVMYWTAADYTGMGYSRPGSLSSEDSTWARREADLGLVIDDIVGLPPLTGPYPNLSSGSGTLSSSLPSSTLSFENLPASSCLGLSSAGGEKGGKYASGTPPKEELQSSTSSRGAVNVKTGEHILHPVLPPIIVIRDLSLSGQVPKGELTYLHEARSPHMPRGRRDAYRWKRSPSPILRCAPSPPPPPPPPSPVGDVRKRRGFTTVRSGSSSPRHWGMTNWSNKQEFDTEDIQRKSFISEAGSCWRDRCVASKPSIRALSGTLLYERLLSISPLTVEQEHPDVALPVQTSLLHNNDPALQLTICRMQNDLHKEIEAFCLQVAAENLIRKPYVTVAMKKVTHALQVLWPRSRTKLFGSNATGLSLPNSDVDLVVCLPPVRNLEPIKEAGILEGRNGIKETCLQHAARYLADQEWVQGDSLKTIENTAIPIIVLVAKIFPDHCDRGATSMHFITGKEATTALPFKTDFATSTDSVQVDDATCQVFDVCKGPWGGQSDRQLVHLDISFEAPSHTGLRTSELVRELIVQFPVISPLALVLKQFLTDRSLDQPYTGGLSSYCLVLLITRFLQHQLHICRAPQNQNLGSLLMGFLHFFGHVFDPRQMCVCIRGGGMYVTRDRFNSIDPLYIEDPLYPMNNVGRNCFRILQCIKAFADAYTIIEKELLEVSGSYIDPYDIGSFRLLRKILPSIAKGCRRQKACMFFEEQTVTCHGC